MIEERSALGAMKTTMRMGMALLILGCGALLALNGPEALAAVEEKEVVIRATHLTLGNLSDLGAVTFIARDETTDTGQQESSTGKGAGESGSGSDTSSGQGKGKGGSGKGKGSSRLINEPLWQRALAWVGLRMTEAHATQPAYSFVVDGDVAAKDRVDGRNYAIDGTTPLGSGDKPGIALDVLDDYLTTSNVTVNGSSPVIQENISTVDVKAYIDYFKNRADVTITSNTTYNGGTIGGPTDYKIVYLKDAKLYLKGAFTGYGVLAIEDTNPGGGLPELRMEDTAKWYGAIIVYSADTSGASDKMKLQFGKQNGGGGGGSGSGKGSGSSHLLSPSLWQRALAWVGLTASEAYADSGSGKGSGSSGKGSGGSGKGSGSGSGVAAGAGVKVYGLVLVEGRDIKVEFPNGGAVADLWYCSQALVNVDNKINTVRFKWEDWREKE